MKLRPGMFASNKEALSARVIAILDMCNIDIDTQALSLRNHKTIGNTYADLLEHPDVEWTTKLINDALNEIKEKEKQNSQS